MPSITFRLNISADKFLRYYQGQAHSVSVVGDDGRRIRLPAVKFRPFLERSGIHGHFRIDFDDNFKFRSLTKISG